MIFFFGKFTRLKYNPNVLLNNMVEFEVRESQNTSYFIMLILTDGFINDLHETIDQIVRASSLPISIIIVGIGDDDFLGMKTLDADREPLYSENLKKITERDIVQFVPFRDYKDNPLELARQTLEEVPRQLVSYFNSRRIKPEKQNFEGSHKTNYSAFQKEKIINILNEFTSSKKIVANVVSKRVPEGSRDFLRNYAIHVSYQNLLFEANKQDQIPI